MPRDDTLSSQCICICRARYIGAVKRRRDDTLSNRIDFTSTNISLFQTRRSSEGERTSIKMSNNCIALMQLHDSMGEKSWRERMARRKRIMYILKLRCMEVLFSHILLFSFCDHRELQNRDIVSLSPFIFYTSKIQRGTSQRSSTRKYRYLLVYIRHRIWLRKTLVWIAVLWLN
jgi:hypothetical protein